MQTPSFEIDEDEEVAPVPGYDGDYWITTSKEVYSLKSGKPQRMSPYEQESCHAVQLSRDGTTTKWSVEAMVRRIFGKSEEVYNDFRLAIDVWLDYDRSVEEVAEIVDKPVDKVRHAVKIWKENNLHRERWAR